MSDVSIAVRCYEENQFTLNTLESIKKNASTNYELIYSPAKLSCAANANRLINMCTTKRIILVDDDIEFTQKNWDDRLMTSLHLDAGIGLVATRLVTKYNTFFNMQTRVPLGKLVTGVKIAGCVLAFKDVGIRFDEGFVRSQYDDTDFAYQYMQKEYLVCVDGSVTAKHMREATCDSGDFVRKNADYFHKKWSVDDRRWGQYRIVYDWGNQLPQTVGFTTSDRGGYSIHKCVNILKYIHSYFINNKVK